MPIDFSILGGGGIALPKPRDPQEEAMQRLQMQTQRINQQVAQQNLLKTQREAQQQMDWSKAATDIWSMTSPYADENGMIPAQSWGEILTKANVPAQFQDNAIQLFRQHNKDIAEQLKESAEAGQTEANIAKTRFETYQKDNQDTANIALGMEPGENRTMFVLARLGSMVANKTISPNQAKTTIQSFTNPKTGEIDDNALHTFLVRTANPSTKLTALEKVSLDGRPTYIQRDEQGNFYSNGRPIDLTGHTVGKVWTMEDMSKEYQAAASMLASARTPQQYASVLNEIAQNAGEEVANQFTPLGGSVTPAQFQQAINDAAKKSSKPLSEYERQSLALQRANNELAERKFKYDQTHKEQPTPTQEENNAVGFYNQMRGALNVLDEIEDKVDSLDLAKIRSMNYGDLSNYLLKDTTSPITKRYVRALDNFIEARLRSVSGKQVTQAEYEMDRKLFGKIAGEDEALRNDRRSSRTTALDAIRFRAGRLGGQLKPYGSKGADDAAIAEFGKPSGGGF